MMIKLTVLAVFLANISSIFPASDPFGAGLIGGIDTTGTVPAYAAIVAPDGTLTQLSGANFPLIDGLIQSVAINDSGVGLIGGFSFAGSQPAYAAIVAPNGTLTELTGAFFP